MSSAIATEKSQALSESQRTALIKLLSDEDPAVYHLVRDKILSYGQTATEWLQPHLFRYGASYKPYEIFTSRLISGTGDDRFSHDGIAHWEGETLYIYDTEPPPEGVRSDLEIIQGLAARVGLGAELAGSAREWKTRLISPAAAARGVTVDAMEAGAVRNPLAATSAPSR